MQIKNFLNNNPDFELVPIEKIWKETISSSCPTQEDMLQLSTFLHQTDGFFVSVMMRTFLEPVFTVSPIV